MKKSDIFIPQFETPFDRFVKPIFQEFTALRQEIVHNWKTEFINGMIRDRNFRDLRDVRLDLGRNGEAVIRLKPEIGFDVEDKLGFYVQFFRTYVRLRNDIFSQLVDHEIAVLYLSQYPGVREDVLKDVKKEWYTTIRPRAHLTIMALKVMIMAQSFGKLKLEDIPAFDLDKFPSEQEFIEAVDNLVREYNVPTMETDKFVSPNRHFYEELDQDLMDKCVSHAKRIVSHAEHPIIRNLKRGLFPETSSL